MGRGVDLDSTAQAAKHPIRHDGPAVAFTAGGLLGNGGLGVVVCLRPDAVVLHFGHNDVWDIRLAENNREAIGTFAEVFEKIRGIQQTETVRALEDDPWYRRYIALARENYSKPYPRPMPCGSVILGLDHSRNEVLGYQIDISRGLCRVNLLLDKRHVCMELFVDLARDRLWARCVDEAGAPCQPFNRIRVQPDPKTPPEFPGAVEHRTADALGFTQVLPRLTEPGADAQEPAQRFRLMAQCPGAELTEGHWPCHRARAELSMHAHDPLERVIRQPHGMALVVDVHHAEDLELSEWAGLPAGNGFSAAFAEAQEAHDAAWRSYWDHSGVELSDSELESIWYRNLYFMRCAVRPGVTCPGLFANWSYANKGSAWHGDYHMNYNTQQPFWLAFSSNHLELNLPYVDLVETLVPMSQRWASEYYNLRGACFPHSAYPVPMTMSPYPVPDWGWEIFETPWTVQGLWWHYTYSMDEDFLRDHAYWPIRQACRFVADYMLRPDACGERFRDDRYHVFPSVAPELYGLRIGFDKNYDTLADLTLIRFVFHAFRQACDVLNRTEQERELLDDISEIMAHFPDTPTADSPEGPVWTPVAGAPPDLVQNCPVSTMPLFPGEEVGLHSTSEALDLAQRTLAIQQNEGGNDLVFLNFQRARAGVLDLERFKRQLRYCTLPNGSCTNMVLQTKGRYTDQLPFDYMATMGIWFENFAIPAVINECLIQGWDGIIHLFPNWPAECDAAFDQLRTVGAFLISARLTDGTVTDVHICSEAGGTCRLISPWPGRTIRIEGAQMRQTFAPAEMITFTMQADERVDVRCI